MVLITRRWCFQTGVLILSIIINSLPAGDGARACQSRYIPSSLACPLRAPGRPGETKFCNCRHACAGLVIKCVDERWRQNETCEEAARRHISGFLEHRAHLTASFSLSSSGAGIYSFSCAPGFALRGRSSFQCGEQPLTEEDVPTCVAVRCDPSVLPDIAYCNMSGEAGVDEARRCVCKHTCAHATLVCGGDGTWNYSHTCTAAARGRFNASVFHLQVKFEYTYSSSQRNGGRYMFECDPGFTLKGSGEARCREGTLLRGEPPYCYLANETRVIETNDSSLWRNISGTDLTPPPTPSTLAPTPPLPHLTPRELPLPPPEHPTTTPEPPSTDESILSTRILSMMPNNDGNNGVLGSSGNEREGISSSLLAVIASLVALALLMVALAVVTCVMLRRRSDQLIGRHEGTARVQKPAEIVTVDLMTLKELYLNESEEQFADVKIH